MIEFECSRCGERELDINCRVGKRERVLCPFCGAAMHQRGSSKRKSYQERCLEIDSEVKLKMRETGLPYLEAREIVMEERKIRHSFLKSKTIKAFGEERTYREWIEHELCVVDNPRSLWTRVEVLGWEPERALKTPVREMVRRGEDAEA